MKTFLKIWLNSTGEKSTSVNDVLTSMGFEPETGPHDYVYNWNDNATIDDALKMADRIHSILSGFNVLFKLKTVEN